MLNTNVIDFRDNMYAMLEQTIKHNELCSVSTKDGNVIIMSEADYHSLMETLAIVSDKSLKEKIITGKNTPLTECVAESEVSW